MRLQEVVDPLNDLMVYCVDVGSIKAGNFAWAGLRTVDNSVVSSADPRRLVSAVAADLSADMSVALGFECPMFVPLPTEPGDLSCARACETFRDRAGKPINRPWSAAAGCASFAIGIPQIAWILRGIRKALGDREIPAFLRWDEFNRSGGGLYLWEAFVTADAKADTHRGDAEIAVGYFAQALPGLVQADANTDTEVYCLAGAALLRTGWSRDFSLLSTPCSVLRA